MSGEKERKRAEARLGNFGECLVEGNNEERARGRKIKRRAIAISVAVQTAGMAALVMAPLLAKPADLVVQNTTPIPPYSRVASERRVGEHHPVRPTMLRDGFFQPTKVPILIITHIDAHPTPPVEGQLIPGAPSGAKSGINVFDTRPQPEIPEKPNVERKRLVLTHIDPALLIHRVEPVYPPLPKQLHRSGKVELHAIIATDGNIQALEVVSGDPLFVRSALDAVQQWRYKPTYLNGQPVEIDTCITVIYTLRQ